MGMTRSHSRFLKVRLFAFLVFLPWLSFGQNADIDLLRFINKNRNEKLDPFFTQISRTVEPVAISYPVSFLVIGVLENDTTMFLKGAAAAIGIGLSGVLNLGVKHGVNRPRPYVTYVDIQNASLAPDPYSFPSGHTTLAFSSATSLYLHYPRWYVAVPAFSWAGLVGYSRMHLGLHYPTDVLAGALTGAGSAWLSYKANQWVKRRYRL